MSCSNAERVTGWHLNPQFSSYESLCFPHPNKAHQAKFLPNYAPLPATSKILLLNVWKWHEWVFIKSSPDFLQSICFSCIGGGWLCHGWHCAQGLCIHPALLAFHRGRGHMLKYHFPPSQIYMETLSGKRKKEWERWVNYINISCILICSMIVQPHK